MTSATGPAPAFSKICAIFGLLLIALAMIAIPGSASAVGNEGSLSSYDGIVSALSSIAVHSGDDIYNRSWTEQTGQAPWKARFGHTTLGMPNGTIVLLGGQTGARKMTCGVQPITGKRGISLPQRPNGQSVWVTPA